MLSLRALISPVRGTGIVAAAVLVLVSGCGGDAGVGGVPEADLDAELETVLTNDGQRGLAAFIQPASEDLGAIPQDPGNPLTPEKVALGQLLFHDTALGTAAVQPEGVGTYGCATCHHAAAGFQAGRRQSIGDGGSGWGLRGEGRVAGYGGGQTDTPFLRSPSALNGAYQDVMHWDGSLGSNGQNLGTDDHWQSGDPTELNWLGYDGLETQAIAALRTHRMDRFEGSILEQNDEYRALWRSVFGDEPISRELVGLAIAAYERTLFANQSPFQRWLRGEQGAMTSSEKRGALVFFGPSGCETCHTGPALAGPGFYALGMPDMTGVGGPGLADAAQGRGGFLEDPDEERKFKVPQLYNLADSPFLGHGGSFSSIEEVVRYYDDGIPEIALPPGRVEPRFKPLGLSTQQIDDLTLFLADALRDPNLARYVPASVPSGNCFPANDLQARRDLGC